MPCRYDPTPQELAESKERARLANKNRELALEKERQAFRDKIDELANTICRLRHLVLELGADPEFAREFTKGEEFKQIRNDQVKHRENDQARAVQELSEMLRSDNAESRQYALDKLNRVMNVKSAHDLIFTKEF